MNDHLALKYDKLASQREHIVHRPDSYCGSKQPKTDTRWVLAQPEPIKLEERKVTFVPALCALFDELLANACDRSQVDPECTEIRVEYDDTSLTVYNTGKGIPVVEHPKHKILVPRMIFGELLTSENYDDTKKKTTGGRNGLGAKLCNIFGTKFRVETSCAATQRKFIGVWSKNMTEYAGDKVGPAAPKDFTRVTFWPDWAQLNLPGFTDDHKALLGKRVIDVAGTVNRRVKVYLNKARVQVNAFKDYCQLYLPEGATLLYEEAHPQWQIGIATAPDAEFRQVSFVNNLCTSKGGTHVEHVATELTKGCLVHLRKTNKDVTLRPAMLRSRMWLFVNARIENPAFSSQTKEELQTNVDEFGSKPDLNDKLIKKILAKKILDGALDFAKFTQDKALNKSDGSKKAKVLGILKLDDANKAGGKESHKCTLLLTEGDSAKALAVSGLSLLGRDYYGVFPLKGKLLNVRGASSKQLLANEEFCNLKKIIGLKQGAEYTNTHELRYGRVMVMTDADKDGSHIKGLLINMFHFFWPSLLRLPDFLWEFVTPVVRVTRGPEAHDFFNEHEFKAWHDAHASEQWAVKYYKGLGTSTRDDALRYFSHLERHMIVFRYRGAADDVAIRLAFEESQADNRKTWLAQPGEPLGMDVEELPFADFVNRELVYYSIASNGRAIPHMMDGLKPSQRKILFAMLRKRMMKDEKVATIGGEVTKLAAYHHGEMSLHKTMVGMAQDFCGSNNINLLVPSGQFGTRSMGGDDAASARYIFTRLNEVTPLLFPADDHHVLPYAEDDGKIVEPVYYAPVLPLALINGAHGIGTGYSTDVAAYHYTDVARNLLKLMAGEALEPMHPWYRDFRGTIVQDDKNAHKYLITGIATKFNDQLVEVTELPVGLWTMNYKKILEHMIEKNRIVRFLEHHNDFEVRFKVYLTAEQMEHAEKQGLVHYFQLVRTFLTSNMVLFNGDGQLAKYATPQDVLQDFYRLRLPLYEQRRQYLMRQLEVKLVELNDKARFVTDVVEQRLELRNVPKATVLAYLETHRFGRVDQSFDYLLDTSLSALTRERVEALLQSRETHQHELDRLRSTTAQAMWKADLTAVLQALQREERQRQADKEANLKVAQQRQQPQLKGHKRGGPAPSTRPPPPNKKPRPAP